MSYLLNLYIPINICIISISYTYAQSQLMGSNPPLNELSARQLGFHPMSRKRGLGAPENLYGFYQSNQIHYVYTFIFICIYIYTYILHMYIVHNTYIHISLYICKHINIYITYIFRAPLLIHPQFMPE